MTKFFHNLSDLFAGLYRSIIWFVILVALLLVAYCAVRGLDMAYDYVNREWFDGDNTYSLIVAAAVLMIVGLLFQGIRRLFRRNKQNPPGGKWPVQGPPRHP